MNIFRSSCNRNYYFLVLLHNIGACDEVAINDAYFHGRIIKWAQHIGFLTLAGMERVVEGNHGNDLKEG